MIVKKKKLLNTLTVKYVNPIPVIIIKDLLKDNPCNSRRNRTPPNTPRLQIIWKSILCISSISTPLIVIPWKDLELRDS